MMIKTQFDVNNKSLKIDNGREFMNSIIDTNFKVGGILHESSSVNTPQRNGHTERKICYILVFRFNLYEVDIVLYYCGLAII